MRKYSVKWKIYASWNESVVAFIFRSLSLWLQFQIFMTVIYCFFMTSCNFTPISQGYKNKFSLLCNLKRQKLGEGPFHARYLDISLLNVKLLA